MSFDDDDDDGNDGHQTTPWRDNVRGNWQIAIQIAHSQLLATSTNTRLAFLRDDLSWLTNQGMSILTPTPFADPLPDLTLSQVLDVFKLLTETYPRYIDTTSRDAVEEIGMRLVQKDESIRDAPKLGVLDHVLGWLANQVAHISKPAPRSAPSSLSIVPRLLSFFFSSSYAAADLFVLLNWSCGLYTTCLAASPDFVSSDGWRALTGIFATLLDLQLAPSTRSKPTMQKSALVRTRRALRSAPQHLHLLMSTLVAHAKSSQSPLVYIPLLATAVDVTIRLKNAKDQSLRQIPPSVKVSAHRVSF